MSGTRAVRFPGASGATLAGTLHLPAGEATGFALMAHCFTCSKDLRGAWAIAEALCARGFGVLRFDFTGLGQSEGELAESTFSCNVADLVAAADFLRDQHQAPAVLVGHSLGGAAVLAAGGRIDEVRAIATIGAPADVAHVKTLISSSEDEIAEQGRATATIAGRSFCVSQAFLDDLEQHELTSQVRALRKPLLLCHAPRDQVVDVDNARVLFEAALHPKSFLSLDDADHLLTRRADADYVGAVIATWAARYVGRIELPEPVERGEAGVVEVRGSGSGFTQDIVASGHRLRSDEPEGLGGANTGPTPYDLLLSGLGACKSMTARMYAERKGWALDSVRVRLRHDKMHADDCDHCETKTGKLDRIDVEVWFEGDLDADKRERLLAITEKCPVQKTLRSEIVIATRAGDDG